MTSEAIKCLEALLPGGPWLLAAIEPQQSEQHKGKIICEWARNAPEVDAFVQRYNGEERWNVYFHANVIENGDENRRATVANVQAMACVMADIDPRALGKDQEETPEDTRTRALSAIDRLGIKPTVVMTSGNGVQAFWRLREPVHIGGEQTVAKLNATRNVALGNRLGADGAVHSLEHIMRLPGTDNYPNFKKREKGRTVRRAELLAVDTELAYPADLFPALTVSAQPEAIAAAASPEDINEALAPYNVPDPIRVIIAQGWHPDLQKDGDQTRNAWMFKALLDLVRRRVPDELIKAMLLDPELGWSEHIRAQKDPGKSADKQITDAKRCVEDSWLAEMNNEFACVAAVGGKFRIMRYVDGRRTYQGKDDFLNSVSNRILHYIDRKGNPGEAPMGKMWLSSEHRRQYETVRFAPGSITPDPIFNTWEGWKIGPPPQGEPESHCGLFLELTRDIICGGVDEYFDWTMDWLAHLVQHPEEPGQVALVLRGGAGLGKSFWVKHLGELVAPHFSHLTNTDHIFGKFNASVSEKLLVFGDEIFASGDQRTRGALKRLVTEETLPVERKGLDVVEEPRFFRFIVATNEAWAVPADIDDRRMCVFDVAATKKNNHAFFKAVDEEWKSGGREAFFALLRSRDLTKYNHRQRPITRALIEQKLYSLRGAERAIYQMLWTGQAPIIAFRDCASPDPLGGGTWQEAFVATSDVTKTAGRGTSEKAVSTQLAKVSAEHGVRHYIRKGEEPRGAWLLPLPKARSMFEEAIGFPITWPEDDGRWASHGASSDQNAPSD